MNQDDLRNRVVKFIKASHISISAFAREIGFERGTYYKWIKHDFDFGEEKCKRIDAYLSRFGF